MIYGVTNIQQTDGKSLGWRSDLLACSFQVTQVNVTRSCTPPIFTG